MKKWKIILGLLMMLMLAGVFNGKAYAMPAEDNMAYEEVDDLDEYIMQNGGYPIADKPVTYRNRSVSGYEQAVEAIYNSMRDRQQWVDLSPYDVSRDEVREIYTYLLNYCPEFFYVGRIGMQYDTENDSVYKISISYDYDKSYSDRYYEALGNAYEEAITDPENMSEVQIARALHDYVCQHVEYDLTYMRYSAYDALVDKKAVCQGYTLMYAALLQLAGIDFDYASSDSMNHIWNLVAIDDKWYHVDTTWDDPVISTEYDAAYLADSVGKAIHNHFLVSDTKIRELDHSNWEALYSCDDTKYDNAYWQGDVTAIFCLEGKEFYLKFSSSNTISMIERTGNTEKVLFSIYDKWYVWGSTSTYWNGLFSKLSYDDGVFYFNDTENVYSVKPGQTSPTVVYNYAKADANIYGALVCDNVLYIGLSKGADTPQTLLTVKLPDKPITNILISVAPEKLIYGYNKGAALKTTVSVGEGYSGTPSYQWYHLIVDEDGFVTETKIEGAESDSYTVPNGLAVGEHYYGVEVTLDDYTKSAVAIVVVSKQDGQIENVNYLLNYVYSGNKITVPSAENFATNAGEITFEWYQDAKQISDVPVKAGSYVLKVKAQGTETTTPVEKEFLVEITKATPQVKFENTSVTVEYTGNFAVIEKPMVILLNGEKYIGDISYEYKAESISGWKKGLPVEPGVYAVRASILATENYNIAVSNEITLTISGIPEEPEVPVVPEEPEDHVYRIKGEDRYETSFKIAAALKKEMQIDRFDAVIISCGTNFADALAGSFLAAKKDAPILMANEKAPKELAEFVSNNLVNNGKIYILGGNAAVSEKIEKALQPHGNIKRLQGATRYETNLEILKEAGVDNEEILVCTGKGFADSLSASAIGKPILLVDGKLTDGQKSYLNGLKGNKYYIIGGTSAVSLDIEKEIKQFNQNVKRLSGDDRYQTSILVAKEFFNNPEEAILTYAKNFPDGLSGGPLAMKKNAPLILTATDYEAKAVGYAHEAKIVKGAVLGGHILISDDAVKKIFNAETVEIWK